MADETLEERARRLWVFGTLATVCTLVTGIYVTLAALRGGHAGAASSQRPEPALPAPVTSDPTEPQLVRLRAGLHIYYRSSREGESGRIVVADPAALEEARWVTQLRCDRAHFGRRNGVCVRSIASSFGSRVSVELTGADLQTRWQFELDGVPSRARLSPDERFAAITLFVSGDDYEADFSTRTKIFELESGRMLPDIEFFDVVHQGRAFHRIDFNYWGVTFAQDSRHAYATLRTGNETHLVNVDIERHTIQTLRQNVECPSLSPSNRRLVYKKRIGGSSAWRLHLLELPTLRDQAVGAEPRSVDDQAEWLDEGHILYALPAHSEGTEQKTNLWLSAVDPGTTKPARIFVEGAASVSIVPDVAKLP